MQVRAVLFDMDGTLTEPLLDFSLIRREIGLPEGSPSVLEAIEKMNAQARTRAIEILTRHEQYAARHSALNPGAKALLTHLRQRSIPIGILTRNCRHCTDLVLQMHELAVDGIITREDGPAKPDGYGVLRLCRQFGVSPANTLVVGDYLHDLQAARSAGAVSILLRTHPRAEEYESYADFSIQRLDEIRQIIDNLLL